MKNNQEYIIELCHSLFAQGKHPSVALIRSHAARPLLIPDVVKGLQRWKQHPETPDNTKISVKKSSSETQTTLTDRVEQLERQVTEISAQLKALLHNNA